MAYISDSRTHRFETAEQRSSDLSFAGAPSIVAAEFCYDGSRTPRTPRKSSDEDDAPLQHSPSGRSLRHLSRILEASFPGSRCPSEEALPPPRLSAMAATRPRSRTSPTSEHISPLLLPERSSSVRPRSRSPYLRSPNSASFIPDFSTELVESGMLPTGLRTPSVFLTPPPPCEIEEDISLGEASIKETEDGVEALTPPERETESPPHTKTNRVSSDEKVVPVKQAFDCEKVLCSHEDCQKPHPVEELPVEIAGDAQGADENSDRESQEAAASEGARTSVAQGYDPERESTMRKKDHDLQDFESKCVHFLTVQLAGYGAHFSPVPSDVSPGEADQDMAQKLRLYTKELREEYLDDPDPLFHRATSSPAPPVTDVFVKRGRGDSFHTQHLRKDSLGFLPNIHSFSSSEDEETSQKETEKEPEDEAAAERPVDDEAPGEDPLQTLLEEEPIEDDPAQIFTIPFRLDDDDRSRSVSVTTEKMLSSRRATSADRYGFKSREDIPTPAKIILRRASQGDFHPQSNQILPARPATPLTSIPSVNFVTVDLSGSLAPSLKPSLKDTSLHPSTPAAPALPATSMEFVLGELVQPQGYAVYSLRCLIGKMPDSAEELLREIIENSAASSARGFEFPGENFQSWRASMDTQISTEEAAGGTEAAEGEGEAGVGAGTGRGADAAIGTGAQENRKISYATLWHEDSSVSSSMMASPIWSRRQSLWRGVFGEPEEGLPTVEDAPEIMTPPRVAAG